MLTIGKSTTASTISGIKKAVIEEQNAIFASLVLAFHNDPANRWLYPNPDQYLIYFPQFVQAFAGKAFKHGIVYCIDNYAGAALWYPPGVEPDLETVMQLMQRSILASDRADVFAVFEQIDHYHPQYPHWYLPFIGVDPIHQRQGYGDALIQPVLKQCDRDQIPAYLESSNIANLSFYQRHGFEVLGSIQAGHSPTIFPMLRRPR